MERNGKTILIVISLLIFAIAGFKYKEFFLDKDFLLLTQVSCDPATENCFRIICDGECDTSSSVIFTDGSPYKYVELPASSAPSCVEDVTCLDFSCSEDDTSCVTTYCSEETLEEGEECVVSTPVIPDLPQE